MEVTSAGLPWLEMEWEDEPEGNLSLGEVEGGL